MNRYLIVLASVAWLQGLSIASRAQIPPGFELIQITNDADYDGPPSINNCGQVVFSKRIGNSFDHEEIFLWDNGTTIQITDDEHRDAFPYINDAGTIVWSRTTQGKNSHFDIARWSGGEIELLTDTPLHSEIAFEINNLGHMTWSRYIGPPCATSDLYFYDGFTAHQITDDQFANGGGAINDSDEIAWNRTDFCVSPWWIGEIMLLSNGTISQLTNDVTQLQSADISADGTIVWGGPNGIEQLRNGVRTVLSPQGGKPEINSHGWVVFNCHPDGTTQSCLYRDGTIVQLTQPPNFNVPSSINDFGEVGINSFGTTIGEFEVLLMRAVTLSPDLDGTGGVDLGDYAVWVPHVTGPVSERLSCALRRFDLNQDQAVDLRDFAMTQVTFGEP